MMKHRVCLLGLCLICLLPALRIFADEDCDQALKEAGVAYKAENYSKAKNLYDYVASECGESYGNAASLSKKCQNALAPKLSVNPSSVSVGANSGSTYITVNSNRSWKLANTGSSLFTVSKNGDYVSISYSANPNTSSRSDYFDVVTTDGTKTVRVYVNQAAKAEEPYLTVNKSSLSASASGTTEYITVSSNVAWEVQYPSGSMYSVTRNGNKLTVTINKNTSSDSRTDFFNVKTTDGSNVRKISLSQAGRTGSYAEINDITVDHNVFKDGYKGMRIHVKFDTYSVLNHTISVCVYFYFSGGNALKGISGSNYVTPNGTVTIQDSSTATYTNSTWNDYTLFMPYAYLNMSSGCKDVSLEGRVGIYDDTAGKWLTDSQKKFTFSFSN